MGILSVLGAVTNWRNGIAGPQRLSVVSGLHQGATIELAQSHYVIGSDADADIILMDSGIEPQHVHVRSAGNRIIVEAVGGDVQVGDRHVHEGRGYRTNVPGGQVELTVGDARVHISAPTGGASLVPFRLAAPITAGALCVFAAVTALAMNASTKNPSQGANVNASSERGFQVAMLGGRDVVGLIGGQDSRPAVSEAAQTLAAQLQALGLGDIALNVEKDRILASGSLAKEDSETWVNAQAWFDQNFEGRIVLSSDVRVRGVEAPPRLSLQAVWYGPRPYVLASDGARYHEGAYIAKGWLIKEISENALLLSRDGATIALKYQ